MRQLLAGLVNWSDWYYYKCVWMIDVARLLPLP